MTQSKPDQAKSFEAALSELEQVVAQLEQGDVNLNEALNQFEKGIGLSKTCHELLTQAEQRVETLLKEKSNNA